MTYSKKMAAVGINRKARITANNVAGIVNLNKEDLDSTPRRQKFTEPKNSYNRHTSPPVMTRRVKMLAISTKTKKKNKSLDIIISMSQW